ncbi:MAG: sigma 54-interacting transcriptional regulator [Polyangiaceae bacterium]
MSGDDRETEKLSGEVLRGGPPRTGTCLLVEWADGSAVVPVSLGAIVVVGRAAPSDVIVDDSSVSRQHARFVGKADGASVEDLGSTNGVHRGGEQVEQADLIHGDEVTLGGVRVTVLSTSALERREIAPHDRFRLWLDEEITRARYLRRALAIAMVRLDRWTGSPRESLPWLRAFLRPIDRVGQYAAGVFEILSPEQSASEVHARLAVAMAKEAPGGGFVAGIAAYPEAGSSTEELLGNTWEVLSRANAERPIGMFAEGERRGVRAVRSSEHRGGTRNRAMQDVLRTAERVARSSVPVLILGETGTGKEVLARSVHDASPRRGAAFISVNCAAIPAPLAESILFGHERGAFTGANQRTQGVFEAALGGTVFLDEIGELPATVQAALLRVLEAKTFARVGSTKEIGSDVRIVAATHRDLVAMVESGTFREDLLYRLNTVVLSLPPLRERMEDIPDLASELLAQAARDVSPTPTLDPDVVELLAAYAWPGNIRELRNVLERALAIADTPLITAEYLPERLRSLRLPLYSRKDTQVPAPVVDLATAPADYRAAMEALETEYLRFALRQNDWNQTHTARRLDMPLRTLVHRMKVLGVRRPLPER